MTYYTIATKTSQVYGHGDNGDEYHICPVDAYHTDSKRFHPLFEEKEDAEKYKDSIEWNHNLIVVGMTVNAT
jgi:hypothetical protein